MHRRTWIFAALLLLGALAPRAGRAQSASALRHAAIAATAEAEEDWARALDEYSAAYSEDSTSNYLLARVVHCVFMLGRDDEQMSLTNLLWQRDSTRDEAASDAAQMAYTQGRMDEAIEWYHAATRANPGNTQHWMHLAMVFEQLQQPSEAEDALEGALRADPDLSDALYHLGWVRARSGHESDALEPLQRLAASEPDYPRGLLLLGEVQENLKHFDEARTVYGELSDRPDLADWTDGLKGLARVSFLSGHYDESLEPLSRLVGLDPTDAEMRKLRLHALLQMHDAARALAEADTISGLDRDNPSWPGLRADLLERLGHPDGARAAVERFSSAHPSLYRAQELVASVNLRQGRFSEALRAAERARLLAPDSSAGAFLCGQVYAAEEKYNDAERWFDVAIHLDSTSESAFYGLGVVRERQGRLPEAEAAFRRVLEIDPHNASALNYVGYMYADRGMNLEQSLKDIDQALAEEPNNAAYLDSRGWALYRLGRLEEARDGLQKAIQAGGTDPAIQTHLGQVEEALRDFQGAAQAYRDALRLDPHNSDLSHRLHAVEKKIP